METNFTQVVNSRREPEIACLVQKGLSPEDAEDIFQEASIVLYQTLSEQRLALRTTPQAYLHGICQNMACKRIEELKRSLNNIDEERLDRLLELTQEPADEEPAEWDYQQILSRLLSELSQRDFSLLRDFYFEGRSMEQVAELHSLSSVEVARTTKCRIISRLRERAASLINELC